MCVNFSSFSVILIIAGVLPVQSPTLNNITIYTCLIAHSNLIQNLSPNLVETTCIMNDAAENRTEDEVLSFIFSFFCKNNSCDMRLLGIWISVLCHVIVKYWKEGAKNRADWRRPLRKQRSIMDCSAIYEEEEMRSVVCNIIF